MLQVFKYELKIVAHQFIDLPDKSKLLSVGFQGDSIFVWALTNPQNISQKVGFYCFCTAQDVCNNDYPTRIELRNSDIEFIGTAHSDDGKFVLHVFKDLNCV